MPKMEEPTRARQIVILFAVTLAVITYVDRICMSQAKLTIQGEFGLSDEQMGWVFSIFTLAYGLFEVPFGWLGDKYGPRIMLLRVVTMWSIFTSATGAASVSGLPAASSNCAWCACNTRAASLPVGHHLKRPLDNRLVASQNP